MIENQIFRGEDGADAIKKLAISGERVELRDCELRKMKLCDVNLSNIDIVDCWVDGCDFERVSFGRLFSTYFYECGFYATLGLIASAGILIHRCDSRPAGGGNFGSMEVDAPRWVPDNPPIIGVAQQMWETLMG